MFGIGEAEINAVADTIRRGVLTRFQGGTEGYLARSERALAEMAGVQHALMVNSGTSALLCAMVALGIGKGDEVLISAYTWISTPLAPMLLQAIPKLVEVNETLTMDPDDLERKITPRTRAIVVIHMANRPCDMDRIMAIADRHGIPVVEDAAEALGSVYKGRYCGTIGKLGALSFNGNKTVTTGGGGAILTNDKELGVRAKHLTTTAKIPHPWEYRHDAVAWNFRLPNLNAALGCAQLEQLDSFLSIKRKRAQAYAKLFSGTKWEFITEPVNCRSNYWLCAVLTGSISERNAFLQEANDSGLGTRPAWAPLHTLPMYRHCRKGNDLPITTDITSRLVNLPSGVGFGI